jgi:hypothetical protein
MVNRKSATEPADESVDANEHKYYYFNLCVFAFIRGFP